MGPYLKNLKENKGKGRKEKQRKLFLYRCYNPCKVPSVAEDMPLWNYLIRKSPNVIALVCVKLDFSKALEGIWFYK